MAATLVVALGAALSDASAESEFVAGEANAVVPLKGETRLGIRDLTGEIAIRAGDPGQIRFASSPVGKTRDELPVGLWTDGRTLRFGPLEGAANPARSITIYVPPEMQVEVDALDSFVSGSELTAGFEVRGERVTAQAANIDGYVLFDLRSGKASVEGVRDATVRGTGLEVTASGVSGRLAVNVTRGKLGVEGSTGSADANLDGVDADFKDCLGPVQVTARWGTLTARGLAAGADLRLSGTPLRLERAKGDVTIETDAPVQFARCEASLHITSYGGAVRGIENKGLLEAKTSGAEVIVEKILGPARVQGADLKISLKDIAGDLIVYAKNSSIAVEHPGADVTIENENGDIAVVNAVGALNVISHGGNVSLTELNGSVILDAEGGDVDLSWIAMSGKDSEIKNESGDVRVVFLGSVGCRVEARTKFGRVEVIGLPRVIAVENGDEAQGIVGGRSNPAVRITANGHIELKGAAAPER